MYCVAIDTGGTFTDIAALCLETSEIQTLKVLSVPRDPGKAILAGLDELQHRHGIGADKISSFIFGTTVATNAVLERKGAPTALLATKGTRDILEIQRQHRQRLFDLNLRKPDPLIPRRFRLEVDERIAADGSAAVALTDAEIDASIEALAKLEVEGVAISLLFSFLNPRHERRLKKALQARRPDLHVTISSDVCPEYREFERTATTAMNAYVMPKVVSLMARLEEVLKERGCAAQVRVIQSNGGQMSIVQTRAQPVNTLMSGPAGGAIGAARIAAAAGFPNAIAMDMGGTSVDITLLQGGEVRLVPESGLGGLPIRVPQVDIHTIGAGGGSIAWLTHGVLKVGPQSAGADPGPACYGRGGTAPTSTDAAVCLGYIDPDDFLGGAIILDAEAARRAIRTLAQPLGMSIVEAAHAVMRVQVASIVAGIREVSVEKGLDPREFVLLPFGGAGALYAGRIAEELDMRCIIVPTRPSVLSAIGMLMSDVKYTRSTTRIASAADVDADFLRGIFAGLETKLEEQMQAESLPRDRVVIERSCDMRYRGQAFEVNVSLAGSGKDVMPRLVERFHREHERLYGHCAAEEPVEVVAFRVTAIGRLQQVELAPLPSAPDPVSHMAKGERRVFFDGKDGEIVRVYDRAALAAGAAIEGPAIIQDAGASIPLFPGHRLAVDRLGNLVVATLRQGAS